MEGHWVAINLKLFEVINVLPVLESLSKYFPSSPKDERIPHKHSSNYRSDHNISGFYRFSLRGSSRLTHKKPRSTESCVIDSSQPTLWPEMIHWEARREYYNGGIILLYVIFNLAMESHLVLSVLSFRIITMICKCLSIRRLNSLDWVVCKIFVIHSTLLHWIQLPSMGSGFLQAFVEYSLHCSALCLNCWASVWASVSAE